MPEHLTIGSVEPPLSPGKLRLYGMRFCPYDHRVHLVLLAKNILHDVVWINLKNKPEWYVKKISTAKVPAVAVSEGCLWESLIISDFLDEKYPERPLHSGDPLQKAQDRILMEAFGKVSGSFYRLVMAKPAPAAEEFEAFVAEVCVFDQELAKRGTQFFGGARPGMVDYMIWPWFERFGAAKIVFGEQFDLTSGNHAKIPHMDREMVLETRYMKPESLDYMSEEPRPLLQRCLCCWERKRINPILIRCYHLRVWYHYSQNSILQLQLRYSWKLLYRCLDCVMCSTLVGWITLYEVSWMDAMKEDKAVKEYALAPEIHARYLKGYLAGNPEFDIEI